MTIRMRVVSSSVVLNRNILMTFGRNSSLSNWRWMKGDSGAVVRAVTSSKEVVGFIPGPGPFRV